MATAARLGSRVDAGLLAGCVVLSLVALALPPENREPIAGALRRTIVAPLVAMQRGAERWRSAWNLSQRQQIVLDSLGMRAITAQALQSENDQLRKVLGLGSRLEWGFVPAEALHSIAPSEDLVTTLTLTAGSTAGIKRYSPVVAPEGLVGTILTADPTMSIAILYTHPDFRASAMSADGAVFGIVYPHATSGDAGDPYMLELRDVPTRSKLEPGSVIYTSGLGGTFPRGVTIGTIVEELRSPEVWTRTYLVRPAVTPSRITTVFVLTPQRVTQGTGSIWGATVNADSATKRIAAAGDSLAKQAALLQARARQATLDSLRRAIIDSVRQSLGAPPMPPGPGSPATRTTQPAQPGRGATTTPRPTAPPATTGTGAGARPDSTQPSPAAPDRGRGRQP